jgi:hypothetical protein
MFCFPIQKYYIAASLNFFFYIIKIMIKYVFSFLVPEFQFTSQMVLSFWKKIKLIHQSSFLSKN